MTAHSKNSNLVNVSFELALFKQMLKSLSLNQMEEVVQFLNQEMHEKIRLGAKEGQQKKKSTTSIAIEQLSSLLDTDITDADEPKMTEEEFNKAVQEMS